MCGIIGWIGNGDAVSTVATGLKSLEYRGYDSAGLAFINNGRINTIKSVGQVDMLIKKINAPKNMEMSIGHTRWATHGGVTEENCHPHLSNDGRVAVVHNGIISNYIELRKELEKQGVKFYSATDTEVIPNVIAKLMSQGQDLYTAVTNACKKLQGSYAFLAICLTETDTIVCAKHGRQPLAIGTEKEFVYLSSDLPALSEKCKTLYALEENEYALIKGRAVKFFFNGEEIKKVPLVFRTAVEKPDKGKYSTFMEKEIFEIPSVIQKIANEYETIVASPQWKEMNKKIAHCGTIHIGACGTSYHAGLYIASQMEKQFRKRTKVHYASELIHNLPYIDANDIAIVISQSGETADTLSALLYFKSQNLYTIGICNVEGSSIARYVDMYLPTFAGREVAVASTKAYIAQILVGEVMCGRNFKLVLGELEAVCNNILGQADEVRQKAQEYRDVKKMFILGKGAETVTALETALKIKEVTYKHCEGFPAGELKHGTLALVDDKTLTIGLGDNVQNALAEVQARGSKVWHVSQTRGGMAVLYGQLFALYLAQSLNLDPDKPRNLAKSVTVE